MAFFFSGLKKNNLFRPGTSAIEKEGMECIRCGSFRGLDSGNHK
jgi:hypothetical protein